MENSNKKAKKFFYWLFNIYSYCCPIKLENSDSPLARACAWGQKKGKNLLAIPQRFCLFVATKLKNYKIMDKVTTNSGIPVFGEVIKLLNKQEITKIYSKSPLEKVGSI